MSTPAGTPVPRPDALRTGAGPDAPSPGPDGTALAPGPGGRDGRGALPSGPGPQAPQPACVPPTRSSAIFSK
jgi:hypothetical protein